MPTEEEARDDRDVVERQRDTMLLAATSALLEAATQAPAWEDRITAADKILRMYGKDAPPPPPPQAAANLLIVDPSTFKQALQGFGSMARLAAPVSGEESGL